MAIGYVARPMSDTIYVHDRDLVNVDSLGRTFIVIEKDTLHTSFLPRVVACHHTGPLRDADFMQIAEELDVEVASIKAVVHIETGRTHRGINPEGFPVINFDPTLFRIYAERRGTDLSAHVKSIALQPLDVKKHGTPQRAHKARLDAAMEIDRIAAIDATFWGMFQIGGFNWKLVGASSRDEFVNFMGRSEYDQLCFFANYIRNTVLLKYLRAKDWTSFARIYNGPGFAKHNYHTRLQAAYEKFRHH